MDNIMLQDSLKSRKPIQSIALHEASWKKNLGLKKLLHSRNGHVKLSTLSLVSDNSSITSTLNNEELDGELMQDTLIFSENHPYNQTLVESDLQKINEKLESLSAMNPKSNTNRLSSLYQANPRRLRPLRGIQKKLVHKILNIFHEIQDRPSTTTASMKSFENVDELSSINSMQIIVNDIQQLMKQDKSALSIDNYKKVRESIHNEPYLSFRDIKNVLISVFPVMNSLGMERWFYFFYNFSCLKDAPIKSPSKYIEFDESTQMIDTKVFLIHFIQFLQRIRSEVNVNIPIVAKSSPDEYPKESISYDLVTNGSKFLSTVIRKLASAMKDLVYFEKDIFLNLASQSHIYGAIPTSNSLRELCKRLFKCNILPAEAEVLFQFLWQKYHSNDGSKSISYSNFILEMKIFRQKMLHSQHMNSDNETVSMVSSLWGASLNEDDNETRNELTSTLNRNSFDSISVSDASYTCATFATDSSLMSSKFSSPSVKEALIRYHSSPYKLPESDIDSMPDNLTNHKPKKVIDDLSLLSSPSVHILPYSVGSSQKAVGKNKSTLIIRAKTPLMLQRSIGPSDNKMFEELSELCDGIVMSSIKKDIRRLPSDLKIQKMKYSLRWNILHKIANYLSRSNLTMELITNKIKLALKQVGYPIYGNIHVSRDMIRKIMSWICDELSDNELDILAISFDINDGHEIELHVILGIMEMLCMLVENSKYSHHRVCHSDVHDNHAENHDVPIKTCPKANRIVLHHLTFVDKIMIEDALVSFATNYQSEISIRILIEGIFSNMDKKYDRETIRSVPLNSSLSVKSPLFASPASTMKTNRSGSQSSKTLSRSNSFKLFPREGNIEKISLLDNLNSNQQLISLIEKQAQAIIILMSKKD